MFFLMTVSIALKGTHFFFLFLFFIPNKLFIYNDLYLEVKSSLSCQFEVWNIDGWKLKTDNCKW